MNQNENAIDKAIAISILGVTAAYLINRGARMYYSTTTLRALKRTSKKWEKAVDAINAQIEQNRIDNEFLDILDHYNP